MSKKAQDYYKDLAKVDPNSSGFKPVTPAFNRAQKKVIVPWGFLSLVAGGGLLFVSVKYFTNHDVSSVIGLVKGHVSMSSKERSLATASEATGTSSDHELPKVGDEAAKSNEPKPDDLVEIDGHYYKKSADNIYYINGKRVFFIDNRSAKAAKK